MDEREAVVVPHRALITVCAMMATLMQSLDSTIANVALPYMQGSLAASSDQITWVLTSYITAAAIMTAPVGWISARFGLKRLFLVFRDRNLSAGLLVMFAVGMVLLAVSALLAPWLQELGNYPVETAGLVMAPRGFGTMAAMLVAGRLSNKVDGRLLMAFGIVVLAWSLYRMTEWTPAVSETTMVINTILQGAGLEFVFIPLQVIAFATLDPALRTEGTALLSLLRNVGSAIGISVTGAMVTQNSQIEHSVLAGYITPLNRAFQGAAAGLMPTTEHAAQVLNGMLTHQAAIIAYNDDWKLMMLTSLPMLLLLLLMRGPKKGSGAAAEHPAVMD